jgi:MGT family glycosyltransferase
VTGQKTAVVFGMREHGHIKRLLPIIAGLAKAGVRSHVFTDARFRAEIEAAGGVHVDLFRGRPIDAADAASIPIPCRYVSFAGHYADEVVAEAAALEPSLVVHDTFAVIGVVVARALGLPRVNVCVGHNHAPEPTLESLRGDPRVRVADDCLRAVDALRLRHHMPEASPFSYVTALSPQLNLYCEPPEYLRPEDQRPFEPIDFVGSLSDSTITRTPPVAPPFGDDASGKLRVYVSFGTVIWRYYEAVARRALEAISDAVGSLHDATGVISLAGAPAAAWTRGLARPNVRVEDYLDQWSVLGAASVFITHQGLNSTHEAVFCGVPMISYPFFADQPALADRCQELGLAVPLAGELRGPVTVTDVHAALARVGERRDAFRMRLAEARAWELNVMARRPQVITRVLDLLA